MQNQVSNSICIEELADIRDVQIDPALSIAERHTSYLQQIKNPNLYRCGDMIVHVSFADKGVSFKERLKQYLLSGQGMDLAND